MASVDEKRAAFRALHADGCFILPNPWDAGSARLLQSLGFAALASTSAGRAWTIGKPDYAVTREEALAYLADICRATDLPVNADYEAGFGATDDMLAESVRLAVATGVAGLSIEDRDLDHARLYDTARAVARLKVARGAIAATGCDVMLVARTEILLDDPAQVSTAIDKLVAFAAAGADCLYAPGVRKDEDIAAMARAVAPRPLNVLAIDPAMTRARLAGLGVRRISVGGSLARVGWAAVAAAAREIADGGFAPLATGMPGRELNALFSKGAN